jgi:hypothetical protein
MVVIRTVEQRNQSLHVETVIALRDLGSRDRSRPRGNPPAPPILALAPQATANTHGAGFCPCERRKSAESAASVPWSKPATGASAVPRLPIATVPAASPSPHPPHRTGSPPLLSRRAGLASPLYPQSRPRVPMNLNPDLYAAGIARYSASSRELVGEPWRLG